jgi:putative ABC transport system permease protein
VDILLQDVRYAARKLLHSPAFTAIVLSTLALAIGATTAVFSIVNGVLLKPLPFRAPAELMTIGVASTTPGQIGPVSGPDFLDYQSRNHSFASISAYFTGNVNLTVNGGSPVRLSTSSVRANFFDVLGIQMERGRPFMNGEDEKGSAKVVIISDNLWRNQFNADPAIIGKSIMLDGTSRAVVGVAAPELTFPDKPDAWLPMVFEDWMIDPANRGAHWLSAIGRLRAGVTRDAAARDLQSIGAALTAEYPESNATIKPVTQPLMDTLVGNARTGLYTMLGAVGFVLLIACANIANLLLIRASTRETEMALRTALGAGRGRIMRQLITESVLLSIGGAMIGGALAAWSVDLVKALSPSGLPRINDITIDGRVLAFTAGLAILTGVIFGLVPALYTARPELAQMLRDSGRSSSARRSSNRARSLFVIAEVGLAVVLLVGAGLMIRSYVKLIQVDPGFRPEHVVTFTVSLPELKYRFDRDRNRFVSSVLDAVNQMPGTQASGVAMSRPMQTIGMRTTFDIDGRPKAAPNARLLADLRPVSSDYFRALGIQLVKGRFFTKAEDGWGPPPAVVVSEQFAKKYFPDGDALGKHITLGVSHDTAEDNKTGVTSRGEIVGIVRDVKQRRLSEQPSPAVYLPHGTFPQSDLSFVVRSDAELSTLTAAIRRRVAEIDPEMPIYDMETMSSAISASLTQPRFYTVLLGGFAGLALLLAALGIYGVISYGVAQRVRELGIRIALGATNDRILKLVLGQGLGLVAVGLVFGIVGAIMLMHLLASLLFGVQPRDLLTFTTVPVLLAGVALIASYLPARKAARVDPVVAMRAE